MVLEALLKRLCKEAMLKRLNAKKQCTYKGGGFISYLLTLCVLVGTLTTDHPTCTSNARNDSTMQ